jgi:hypothetical protein
MSDDLLGKIQEASDNSTTIRQADVYVHPVKDKMVHVMLHMVHDQSGLKYNHLVRMPSPLAKKLSDDLRTQAHLTDTGGPAF